jgi:leucyl aminopeptidase
MSMKFTLTSGAPSQIETECLVVTVVDATADNNNGNKSDKPNPQIQTDDKAVLAAAADLIASGEVTGKMLETTLLHKPQGVKAKRLLLIGGGKASKFNSAELRKLAGAAVRAVKAKDLKSFALVMPSGVDDAAKAIVEGAVVGNFDADYYRSDRTNQKIEELTLVASKGTNQQSLKRAMEQGGIIGEAQNFARDLVNEPGNRMTPTILADRAKAMCDETGLKCDIYGPDKIKEMKMGAFWSVSQGSDEEPRLIVMRYEPERAPKKRVLGLVGKGITFDTGGISIKPADNMEKMKYDMAGGAAMLGAMRAIALLKPRVRVIAIVCAAENMPSGTAQKPGDVQTAMALAPDKPGKTIEIINTDAEGRLVLADGLTYARQLGATHLIDAATLTGAISVALGRTTGGAFSNDDPTYAKFETALAVSGEKFWRLPLGEEYAELIKSDISDIKNTGGRYGGASIAAEFLHTFAEDTPWIHLDIAGVAWVEESRPYVAKGPSGVAVRSILEWVRSF